MVSRFVVVIVVVIDAKRSVFFFQYIETYKYGFPLGTNLKRIYSV